ncbi:MAG: hybrid sensor histidine kinase/response regulator [Deltaproteobacteria bacterium]|nr:hybrid sensor histidine kinase/response regulator [Deltaproteobacteria bacterium]MBN2674381.1 hybrid sensor histidine kinase/response regulator [Deltaproteobacteria bacterium]
MNLHLLVFDEDGKCLFSRWNYGAQLGSQPEKFIDVIAWLGDTRDASELRALYESRTISSFQSDFSVSKSPGTHHFRLQIASVEWEGTPAVAVQVSDITGEYKLFREMELLERQASAGQMAAGVAHEFNNILTAMMGWTQLASRTVDGNDTALMALSTIDNNTKRARRIAAELLEITSPSKTIETHSLFLGDVVKEALKLLNWELANQQINVVEEIFETSASKANTTRLVQVFVNVIKNAMDAMSVRGTLGVRVIQVNGAVVATISDTGEGISDENIEKVFRPFFTTKSRDDDSHGGSGLGMAISKRIVEDFGGTIAISRDTNSGMGTVVTVTLPAHEDDRESVHDEPRTPSSFPPGIAVLVVDDEPDICEMIRMALSLRGAHVVSATNGEDAVAMCERELFNAAFLDFSMSGLSGHELKNAISVLQPTLPIVFMSGVDIPSLENQDDFLKKPFDLHDIQCKLREILER